MKMGHVDDNCTVYFQVKTCVLILVSHALKFAIPHLLLVTQCRDTSVTYFKHDIPKRVFFLIYRLLYKIEVTVTIHDVDEKIRRRIFVQDSALLLPSCIGSEYKCIQARDRTKNLHTPG